MFVAREHGNRMVIASNVHFSIYVFSSHTYSDCEAATPLLKLLTILLTNNQYTGLHTELLMGHLFNLLLMLLFFAYMSSPVPLVG